MKEQESRIAKWLSPATILLLVTGILVPIVAALIPAAIDFLKTQDDFTYTTSSISVGNRTAFRISVRNRGKVVERNVEIWLRQDKQQTYDFDLTSAPPGTRIRDEGQHKVVAVGDLRPSESAWISAITASNTSPSAEGAGHYSGFKTVLFFGVVPTRIVSADRAATRAMEGVPTESAMVFVYRAGFWAFIIVVVAAVAWALAARWRKVQG